MAKHIHIHLPRRKTGDATWEESKHPRKDNGEFGSGSGSGSGQGQKKPSKAELKKQASAEYRLAGQGHGNYARAARLFEAAGDKERAAMANALAKQYGHDEKGQKKKGDDDAASAAEARKDAAAATDEKVKKLLGEQADLYDKRAKDPENNALTSRIHELDDEIARAQSKK